MIIPPYRNKGVFPSELHCFLETFRFHECYAVVESGVLSGYSTEVLRTNLYDLPVFSYEKDLLEETRQRFADPVNEDHILIAGDALALIPELFRSGPSNWTYGVLIDGPKQELALKLKDDCLMFPHVAFVAIHDLRDEYRALGDHNTIDAYKDEGTAKLFNDLDKDVGAYKKKYPKGSGLTFFINKKSGK